MFEKTKEQIEIFAEKTERTSFILNKMKDLHRSGDYPLFYQQAHNDTFKPAPHQTLNLNQQEIAMFEGLFERAQPIVELAVRTSSLSELLALTFNHIYDQYHIFIGQTFISRFRNILSAVTYVNPKETTDATVNDSTIIHRIKASPLYQRVLQINNYENTPYTNNTLFEGYFHDEFNELKHVFSGELKLLESKNKQQFNQNIPNTKVMIRIIEDTLEHIQAGHENYTTRDRAKKQTLALIHNINRMYTNKHTHIDIEQFHQLFDTIIPKHDIILQNDPFMTEVITTETELGY